MIRFWAYRARREGKPVPRWQLQNATWSECELTLGEEFVDAVGRTLRVGRLLSGRGDDIFPPLLDAQLILADHTRLIMSGIESADSALGERAQTWVLHTHDRQEPRTVGFWCCQVRRDGRLVADEAPTPPEWMEGRLALQEERDDWLGRTVRVCRLKSPDGGDVVPPLIEAQLVLANQDRLVFSGIERDALTRCDKLQGWLLYPRERGGRASANMPKRAHSELLPP